MKTIKLFMVYFGKFPDYFDLWLKAAGYNETIDFVIISDAVFEKSDLPCNVKALRMSFDEFRNKIQEKFDFRISLNSPARISQFRPALAYVFDGEVEGYDCWGYIECDLIPGDIRAFISDDLIEEYDKFFKLGHFQIFRNNQRMNTLFMQTYKSALSYRFAFSKNIFYFEELLGMHNIANAAGCRTYTENIFADLKSYKYRFEISSYGYPSQVNENGLCAYKQGKLYWYTLLGDTIEKKEILYVHLQKRKMNNCTSSADSFLIIPNQFIPYETVTDKLYNELMARCEPEEEDYQEKMMSMLSKSRKKHYREFCWWQLKLLRKRIVKNGGVDLDGK